MNSVGILLLFSTELLFAPSSLPKQRHRKHLSQSENPVVFAKTRSSKFKDEPCPNTKVESCFKQAFQEIATYTKVKLKHKTRSECNAYATFQLCFGFAQCSMQVLAGTAAAEYKTMHQKHRVSEQTMLALYGNLNGKCAVGCSKQVEENCRLEMHPSVQDKDQALLLELNGQKLQLQLGMVLSRPGCRKFHDTMRRWTAFRALYCDSASVFCYCKTHTASLKQKCRLDCEKFKSMWILSATIRHQSTVVVSIAACFVLILLRCCQPVPAL